MSRSDKKLAIGLLVGVVVIGGLFALKRTKGQQPPPAVRNDVKKKQFELSDLRVGAEGSPETLPSGGRPKKADAAADAQATVAEASTQEETTQAKSKPETQVCWPASLVKYAAIASVLDNTIQTAGVWGATDYYFSSRGVVAEIIGHQATARIWTREGYRLCAAKDVSSKQCFDLTVHLEKPLQDGPIDQIIKRIKGLAVGSKIGEVDGMGVKAELVRGNVANFPEYVPLLEPEPKLLESPVAPGLVGRLLAHSRAAEDQAVTYFAPTGVLLIVERANWTRDIVKISMGKWRLSGDRMCRDLPLGGGEQLTEECSRVRVVDWTVEFPDADASRRNYVRKLSSEEEQRIADQAAQAAQVQERANSALTLAPAANSR